MSDQSDVTAATDLDHMIKVEPKDLDDESDFTDVHAVALPHETERTALSVTSGQGQGDSINISQNRVLTSVHEPQVNGLQNGMAATNQSDTQLKSQRFPMFSANPKSVRYDAANFRRKRLMHAAGSQFVPLRKRGGHETGEADRKRLMQREKEEHEQRMKNLKLEADVFELQRVKLPKQIQLLSNLNAFNMAMQ